MNQRSGVPSQNKSGGNYDKAMYDVCARSHSVSDGHSRVFKVGHTNTMK